MAIIRVKVKGKKLKALLAFFKAFDIKHSVKLESPYDIELLNKGKKGKKDEFSSSKVSKNPKNLWG